MSSQAKNRSASGLGLKLLLLAFSVVFAFLSAELALTLYSNILKQKTARERPDFDNRTRLEVMRDLADEGVETLPPFQFHSLGSGYQLEVDGKQILPIVGISNVIIVSCNELGDYHIYDSDEHGFNSPQGLHVPHPYVVTIGDSFTHGACVRTEYNLASVIGETYPSTLNLGCGGNGPMLDLATLIEYAKPLQPRNVVWLHYEGNDMADLNKEKKIPLLHRYLEADFSQDLRSLQPEIDLSLREFISTAKVKAEAEESRGFASKFFEFKQLRRRIIGFWKQTPWGDQSDFDLLRKTLAKARDITTAWGGHFYFVYLPAGSRFTNHYKLGAAHESVLEIVEELGIPYTDITGSFLATGAPHSLFPFNKPYRHYNEAGYRVVGEAIVRMIERNSKP